jgi:tRNA1Val (adenine37-N6)-methyltransferase
MPRRKHLFSFRQFDIRQEKNPFKVGTDGVLLGAWAGEDQHEAILDIGAGTGLISLMLAQRFPNAQVTGIELQQSAAEEAQLNAISSPFARRVNILHTDALLWDTPLRFDLIVSNPPYFLKSLPSLQSGKRLARHQESLSLQNLIPKARHLLSENGRLALILPAEMMPYAEQLALEAGLFPIRKCLVKSREDDAPVRILQEWGLQPACPELNELVIYDSNNSYTPAYKVWTKDFYLY